jgi:hypothetical protein
MANPVGRSISEMLAALEETGRPSQQAGHHLHRRDGAGPLPDAQRRRRVGNDRDCDN